LKSLIENWQPAALAQVVALLAKYDTCPIQESIINTLNGPADVAGAA